MTEKHHLEIISQLDARLEPFRSQWQQLSKQAEYKNPFWSPDICLPAMAAYASRSTAIAALYTDHRLVALAPFETYTPVPFGPTVSALWQNPYLPLGNPLLAEGFEEDWPLFFQLLEKVTDAPIFCSNIDKHILKRIVDPSCQSCFKIEDRERACVETSETGPAYRIATLSNRRRRGLERKFRNLEKIGSVQVKLSTDLDDVSKAFENFLQLELAGWKGAEKTALLCKRRDADFARQMIHNMALRNACYIATLLLERQPIASLVILKDGETHFTWKTAFDEAYKAYSPGSQLLARFADEFMETRPWFHLDSCTTPDNQTANAVMGERKLSSTLLIANKQNQLSARIAQNVFVTNGKLKSSIKRIFK